MNRFRCMLVITLAAALTAGAFAQQQPAAKESADDAKAKRQAELEQKFIDLLSGSTLVGSFTVTDRGDDTRLRTERYTINKVSKMADNLFLFEARLQYGDKDIVVPMPLTVIWAGDTPMITLTRANIPGAGRYTARVIFYDNKYAGTWDGETHGGHLFGTITKDSPEPASDATGDCGSAD